MLRCLCRTAITCSLEDVNICGSNISEAGLEKLVRGWPNLTHISIGMSGHATDRALNHIVNNLHGLRFINLQSEPLHTRSWDVTRNWNDNGSTFVGSEGLEQLMTVSSLLVVAMSSERRDIRQFVASRGPDIETCYTGDATRESAVQFRREVNGQLTIKNCRSARGRE